MVAVNPPLPASQTAIPPSSDEPALLAALEQHLRRLPPLAALYNAILQDAAGAPIWAVGGVLRDLVHDPTGEPREFDLTIELDDLAATIRVAQAIAARTGATIQTHKNFGTATLELPLGPVGSKCEKLARVDISTARREHYARTAALPSISPAAIEVDLSRRDFTINSLALKLNDAPSPHNAHHRGSFLDLFGGRSDLAKRRLRILHADSFRDDPTRLLRACRYAARISTHGHSAQLRRETGRAAREARPLLAQLTPARFGEAWRLLITDSASAGALQRAQSLQLPSARLPTWTLPPRLLGYYCPRLAHEWQVDPGELFWALSGLLLPWSAPSETFPALVGLRRTEREALLDATRLRAAKPIIGRRSTPPSRVATLLRPSLPVVLAAAHIAWRGTAGHRIDSYINTWLWVESPLDAQALLDQGVKQGPDLHRWLNVLRDAVLDDRLAPDSEQCALWLQSRLRHS